MFEIADFKPAECRAAALRTSTNHTIQKYIIKEKIIAADRVKKPERNILIAQTRLKKQIPRT